MRVKAGDWWTTDKRGESQAHRVATVIPWVADYAGETEETAAVLRHSTNMDRWIPLCKCGAQEKPRTESPALYSTFMPWDGHPRCSACEVLSPAFDKWLADQANSA